jgi:alkaline phosphatase
MKTPNVTLWIEAAAFSAMLAMPITNACASGLGRPAKVLHEYTLPSYSLAHWGYTVEELAAAAPYMLTDRPSIGSGLQHLVGNYYLSVTDRGPSSKPADKRFFPLPSFTPTIVLFKTVQDEIVPEVWLPILVGEDGPGVTGIPNSATEDSTPYFPPATRLPFNPNGLDIEDIHLLPQGMFLLVEEYSPSVVVASLSGVVLKRYIPASKTLPGAAYPVSSTLPSILNQVRANRGLESIAVSPLGQTAYAIMQSPLGPTKNTPYLNSRVLRMLRLDVSNPLNIQVTGQFIALMSPASEYPAGNTPDVLKVSSAAWVSHDKLLLLERTDEAGKGGAKLILVDLNHATDISQMPVANTLVLEDVNTDLSALGITPAVSSTVLYFNEELPEITDYKLEGLSILNANEVAISNDNDFGVTMDPEASSRMWIVRLKERLPLCW